MSQSNDRVAEVRAGKLAPVYLITGGDPAPIDELLGALRDQVVPGAARDLSYDVLRGDEVGGEMVVAAARTHPMLGRQRLVVVRGHEMLEKKGAAALTAYFAKPSPSAVLVLVVSGKLDGRQKLWAAAQKSKNVVQVSYEPLKPWEGAEFARGRAQDGGVRLGRDAAELLVDIVGAERSALVDAVERLRLTVAPRTEITTEDVAETLAATRLRTVFELCDAVGGRQLRRALDLCAAMALAREPPIKVVAMLARQMRTLGRARALGNQATAATLGVHPMGVRKVLEQARGYDGPRLERALQSLAEADRLLKSSRVGDTLILERLVLDLCR